MSDLEAAAAAAASSVTVATSTSPRPDQQPHQPHHHSHSIEGGEDEMAFRRSYPRGNSSGPRRSGRPPMPSYYNNNNRSGPPRYSRYGGGGSSSSSGAYHPYERSRPSSSSSVQRRPAASGWTPRPRTIDEVIRSGDGLLLEYAEFLRLDDAPREEEASASMREAAYTAYLQRHRQAILDRFFWSHRRDAWLAEAVDDAKHASLLADRFREAIERGQMVDICLEDGEDLQQQHIGEGEEPSVNPSAKSNGQRSLPASIRLPERILPGIIESAKNVIVASNLPPNLPKTRFEEIVAGALEQSSLNITDYAVEMSMPQPDKAFYRGAWIIFPDDSNVDLAAALKALDQVAPFENAKLFFATHPRSFSRTIRLAHPEFSSPERILHDLEAAGRLLGLLDARAQLPRLASLSEHSGEARQGLDLMIAYLRRVHHYCYYCGYWAANSQELIQQCGHVHVRLGEKLEGNSHSDLVVVTPEWLDQRIDDICSVLEAAAALTHQRGSEEDEEKRLEREDGAIERQHVTKVEEGRYRCSSCSKLFRGPEFVVKHIRLKHEDLVGVVLAEQALLKQFTVKPPIIAIPLRGGRKGYNSSSGSRRPAPPTSNSSSSSSSSTTTSALPMDDPRDRSRGGYYSRTSHPHATMAPPRGPPEGAPPIPRRPLRAYVDLDAPASGDVEISYD